MSIFSFFSRQKQPAQRVKTIVVRGFDAAKTDRLNYTWTTSSSSVNQDIYQALRILKARSRDLYYNNPLMRDYIRKAKNNIVGSHGPSLQVQCKTLRGKKDEKACDTFENDFKAWGKRGACDVTGKLSFAGVLRLCIGLQELDGEYLVRLHRGYPNKWGFALQVVDCDYLDIEHNDASNNIRMGVESDEYGKPIAYWLLTRHPNEFTFGKRQVKESRIRVPASEIYHGFDSFAADQIRGVPNGHAAFPIMRQMQGYEEAEVIAARVASSKMGFFTRNEMGQGYEGEDTDDGDIITDAEPGTFEQLPYGVGFQTFDPQHPAGNFPSFLKSLTRRVAGGFGIAYHTLANDLEGVNYSSGRLGEQESRDNWQTKQSENLFPLCDWIYTEWLKMQLTTGRLGYGMTDFERLDVKTWQGRRWAAVDPLKDINADIAAIDANIMSRGDAIRKSGRDPDEVWEEIARENEKLDALGLTPVAPVMPGESEPDTEEQQNKEELEDAA